MPDTQFDRIPPTDTDARPGTVLYAAKRDARRADGHEDDSDYRSERDTREKDTPISRSPL